MVKDGIERFNLYPEPTEACFSSLSRLGGDCFSAVHAGRQEQESSGLITSIEIVMKCASHCFKG